MPPAPIGNALHMLMSESVCAELSGGVSRYERAHYPDGRRCNRWYLIDQHGGSHLAVIGVERDTKDGHYNYSAVRHQTCSPVDLAQENKMH